MTRLTWTQPEDLVVHAIAAAIEEGRDAATILDRWRAAAGIWPPVSSGASTVAALPEQRALARELLAELDEIELPAELIADEPDDLERIRSLSTGSLRRVVGDDLHDRLHGAWLGRASGCLLGKPVEKLTREGIRDIGRSTDNWPIRKYFTAAGLDPEVARRYPWNRRSRPTSLIENISGMPEDDDLNFTMIALELLERVGPHFSTADVAESWLAFLPAGRVFTAERVTYRNLLDGYEPEVAGSIRNPFREWIGAQIRADLYGWINPGRPDRAAECAWHDARLSHRRNGVYGAMFCAAACAAALTASTVDEVIEAGLGVIPSRSRYAAAVRLGVDLARSPLGMEEALDALHAEYEGMHWVHVLNNSALLAFAVTRGGGDFATTVGVAVMGGWDTDSVGATAGSIVGALSGARGIPAEWTAPLENRVATTLPGFDGIGFDELARRTLEVVQGAER